MRAGNILSGSYVHCLKRGGRGSPIVLDKSDQWRFIRSLYYLNDEFFDDNWDQPYLTTNNNKLINKKEKFLFYRPPEWPEQKPLVKILCYILMPNHVHLLVKEVQKNGISFFMKKLGQSMTNHFNFKYQTRGSIFQGRYKGKAVDDDEYLKYLAVYIMVKNAFDLYPGGLNEAFKNYNQAWKFALDYPFSSLKNYATNKQSLIVDKDLLGQIFKSTVDFNNFSKEAIKFMALIKNQDEDEDSLLKIVKLNF